MFAIQNLQIIAFGESGALLSSAAAQARDIIGGGLAGIEVRPYQLYITSTTFGTWITDSESSIFSCLVGDLAFWAPKIRFSQSKMGIAYPGPKNKGPQESGEVCAELAFTANPKRLRLSLRWFP